MEFNKSVENPLLVGAINMMRENPTDENKLTFINEMLKAEFITPVTITPPPERDEEGNPVLLSEKKVEFSTLPTKDGKYFFMAFTDKDELDKWKPGTEKYTFTCSFEDFLMLILKRDDEGEFSPMLGFVVNPFGCNMVIDRNMMINLFVRKRPPKPKK